MPLFRKKVNSTYPTGEHIECSPWCWQFKNWGKWSR